MEALTESEYVNIFRNETISFSISETFNFPVSHSLILFLRLQVTQRGEQSLAAVWSEKGQVEIFDLRPQLEAVHSSDAMEAFIKQQKEATALFSFSGHMTEGFAIDWSPTVPGKLIFNLQ